MPNLAATLRRLVVCQGVTELLTALAAVSEHETSTGQSTAFEDHLILLDHGAARSDAYSSFARRVASRSHHWARVSLIDGNALAEMEREPFAVALEHMRKNCAATVIDELFLSGDWQFPNRLAMKAFREARRFCFGDGPGFFLSQRYFDDPEAHRRETLSGRLRFAARRARDIWRGGFARREQFDRGYFAFPDALSERPPMKFAPIPLARLKTRYESARGILEAGSTRRVLDFAKGRPITVFPTSNLSDWRMSRESEIAAYREFAESRRLPPSVLLVKPHPRESAAKWREVERALAPLFVETMTLSEDESFFAPIELLVLDLLDQGLAPSDLHVFSFGATTLTLPALFGVRPVSGFGADLVTRYFRPEHVRSRLRFERDLSAALLATPL